MSRTTGLLAPFLRRQWPTLVVAGLSSLAVAAAEIARPFPLKLVVDGLLARHGQEPFRLTPGDLSLVAAVGALVIAIALVDALASYLIDVRLERAGERIVHQLRMALYEHLQRLSLAFHHHRPTGDLVTRVTGDVNAIGELFSQSLGTVATSVLLLVGMAVVSVRIDPVLAVVAFSVTPILGGITVRFRRRLKATSSRQRAQEGEIASNAEEALAAMREVKALGSERFERERLRQHSQAAQQAAIETAHIKGRFGGLIDVTGAFGSALVLVVGVFRVASGAMSVGDLIVIHSYVRRLYRPLRDLARQAGRVARAMARGDRIAEILAERALLEDDRGVLGGRARGDLRFEHVTFAYEPDRGALTNVSLEIPAGQRVALIGPSGAGKSTLAALIPRFYDPTRGRILIDGRDARDWSRAWLRSQIGIVPQDTVLFSGTVAENIAYATEATREEVIAAAQAANAHGFITELPLGYDTLLGPRGVGLSGGQRQRLAVARTLLRDPPILLLDEPTTGLDAETEAQVLRGLDTLMRNRTVVFATHSLTLARTAERIIVVDGGRIVEEGSPADLLAEPTSSHRAVTQKGGRGPLPALPAVPRDDALPTMPRLLDAKAMTEVFARTLAGDQPTPNLRVHCLRYKPGTNLVVHYDVSLNGHRHDATAMIARGGSLPRRAVKPHSQALAARVCGRTPARPLHYDGEIEALLQWLPLDLSLPALALPPRDLRRHLQRSGLDVASEGKVPRCLNYKPRRRAVLELDGHIIKLYESHEHAMRAARGLRVGAGLRGLRTAEPEVVLPKLRATVQRRLPGTRPSHAQDVTSEAGRLLHALHAATPNETLELRDPDHQLEQAARSGQLLAAVLPGLASEVEELMATLAAERPSLKLVLCHGDFHAGQLLVGEATTLIDLDQICLAPPALDLTTFAAHLVGGGDHDLAAAQAVLDGLLDAYGRRPESLGWYLATAILRRAPFPFRYLDEHWPERIATMVKDARAAFMT